MNEFEHYDEEYKVEGDYKERKIDKNRFLGSFLINPQQKFIMLQQNGNCHKFKDVPEALNFLMDFDKMTFFFLELLCDRAGDS